MTMRGGGEPLNQFAAAERDKGRATHTQIRDEWDEALCTMLIQLGHSAFVVTPWTQGVQKLMLSVGPKKKEAVLLKAGLLPMTT